MSVDLSVEPTCGDLCVGVLPNIVQSGGLKIVSVVVSTQVNLAASTCWILPCFYACYTFTLSWKIS